MRIQVLEIEKHKWIESEKAGFDKGKECCLSWIELYAKEFYINYWRNKW
jgi:hypothetical protein